MCSWLDSSYSRSDAPVIEVGAACSLLWGLFGIALLGAATHRAHKTVRDHDAAVLASRGSPARGGRRRSEPPPDDGAPAGPDAPAQTAPG